MSDTDSELVTLHDTGSGALPSSEEPVLQEEDDDPLGVKQLSLNFEYLMYKINDRVKTLSEQTEEVITNQHVKYSKDIDKIDHDINCIDTLTKKYQLIMTEFVKLEQLAYIVKDFDSRLASIETKVKKLK